MKNERRIQILANKQLMYVYMQKMHNYPILVLMLYARILPQSGSARSMGDWVCQLTECLQQFAHHLMRLIGQSSVCKDRWKDQPAAGNADEKKPVSDHAIDFNFVFNMTAVHAWLNQNATSFWELSSFRKRRCSRREISSMSKTDLT